MSVNLKTIASFIKSSGVSRIVETKPQTFEKINLGLKTLSMDTVQFSRSFVPEAKAGINLKEIDDSYNLLKAGRSQNYSKCGINVDVGQGCIYVGGPGEKIKSYGFDTCAPFIVWTESAGKRALGHIDSQSTAQEIAKSVRNNFSPEEIKKASFHYMRGAETFQPEKKLGDYAIKTIEDALNLLGVKGKYHGALKTGMEDVALNRDSIKVIDEFGESKILDL